jgi:nitrite reductase (NADH) large subunit
MKEVIILGGGVAGLSCAQQIRMRDNDVSLTLIDKRPYSLDKKAFLNDLSAKAWVSFDGWAQEHNVTFIQAEVERLNPLRKKIYFKEREALGFEKLIVASGLISKKTSILGHHREGFFPCDQIDPLKLKELLKVVHEAAVSARSLLGIKLACALQAVKKEVRLFIESLDCFLDERVFLEQMCSAWGIRVYEGAFLEEVIGEGMVKAVKVNPLKVFSSQLVCLEDEFSPNLEFIEGGLECENTFFTNYQDLYCIGDVTRSAVGRERFFLWNHEEALIHGRLIAAYLTEGIAPVFMARIPEPADIHKEVEAIKSCYEHSIVSMNREEV